MFPGILCVIMQGKTCLENRIQEKDIEKEKPAAAPEEQKEESKVQEPKKKASKTWEAMMRLKGCLIVNDPKFLL